MKWTTPLTPALLVAAAVHALPQRDQAQLTGEGVALRLVTFNIRFDGTNLEAGERPWWDALCDMGYDYEHCRMPQVVNHLRDLVTSAPPGASTLISLQEVLSHQRADVQANLGASWASIGVGRDDGRHKGEHCPILYDTRLLRLVHSETKWLSETPDKPSRMPGTNNPRVVTIGVFEDRASGERFIHANTHLDAWVGDARAAQVRVVVECLRDVRSRFGPLPVSLAGDFNSQPGEDAYETMRQSGYMRELWDLAKPGARGGVFEATYTTFSPGQDESVLDFIWVGPDDEDLFEVRGYHVMSNVEGEMFFSDHRAVVGDVVLKTR